jgi:hypothetical protein
MKLSKSAFASISVGCDAAAMLALSSFTLRFSASSSSSPPSSTPPSELTDPSDGFAVPSNLLTLAGMGETWSTLTAGEPSIELGRVLDELAYEMDDRRREWPIDRERLSDEAPDGESNVALPFKFGE